MSWYYYQSGEQLGPFTWDELKQLAADGSIQRDDMVREDQMEQPVKAGEHQELASCFTAAPGLLESSSRAIRLHAELKKLRWSDLPKAKLAMAVKAVKTSQLPPEAANHLERIRDLQREILALEASGTSPESVEARSKLVSGARDLAQAAGRKAKAQTLKRQQRSELEHLADATLAVEGYEPPAEFQKEFNVCRELQDRAAELELEAGPVFDREAAAKSWSDVKGDLNDVGQRAQRKVRERQLRRALALADRDLGEALVAANWPQSQSDSDLAALGRDVADADAWLAELSSDSETPEGSRGGKALLQRGLGKIRSAVAVRRLLNQRRARLTELGTAARGKLAPLTETQPPAAWTEPLVSGIEIERQLEQLRSEQAAAAPLRISPMVYLGGASAVAAMVLLVVVIGNWMVGDTKSPQQANGPVALADQGAAAEASDRTDSAKGSASQERTSATSNASDQPATGSPPPTMKATAAAQSTRQTPQGARAPQPNPPSGLPTSLVPLTPPNLQAMMAPMLKTEAVAEREPPPASGQAFPRKLSGVYHGSLGGTRGTGYVWLEVKFDGIGTQAPPPKKLSAYRLASLRRERERMDKQGGMGLSEHLFEQLSNAFGPTARAVYGTVTVSHIGNPQLHPREKGYLEERQVKVDTATFSGWVDEHERLMSIHATRWTTGKDYFIVNVMRNLQLSGYWLPEEKMVNGWCERHWHHFALTADEGAAAELKDFAIALNQGGSREDGQAIAELGRTYRDSPEAKADLAKATKWMSPLLIPEHADMFQKMKSGDLNFRCMSLFSSDHFAECFGKPVHALNAIDRYRISQAMDAAAKAYPAKDPRQGYDYFAGALRDMSGLLSDRAYSTTLAFAATQRAKQRWREQFQTANETAASYTGAFEAFQRTEPWRSLAAQGLLPNQKQKMLDRFAQVGAGRALAALERWQRPLESDEDTEQFEALLSAVDPQHAAKFRQKAAQLATRKLLRQLEDDFQKFVALKDDVKAVRAVGEWLSRYSNQYRTLSRGETASIYQSAYDYGVKRHQRLLTTYLPHVLYQLDSAKSESAIQSVQDWTLLGSRSGQTREAQKIESAIARNRARLKREHQLKFFSPQEREWISDATGRVVVPSEIPEPTPDSIRAAFYREMSKLPGSRWTAPDYVEYSVPPLDRMNMYYQLEIVRVDKLVIPESQHPEGQAGRTALADGEGYRCFFRIQPRLQIPDMKAFGIKPDDIQARILAGVMKLAEAEAKVTTLSDVFVLTDQGWRSPTIRKRGLQSLVKVYTSWAEGLSNIGRGMSSWPVARGRRLRVRVGNRYYDKWVYP